MIEEWKIVEDYPDYQISNLGRVKSLKNRKERMLKLLHNRGYNQISLCNNKKNKIYSIHRLVLMTFKPISNSELYQCNHINGIKNDNRVENLEWCTAKENYKHAVKIGLINIEGNMYGRHHSEESKKKMAESHSGEKHYMYGKHHSKETKRKISDKQKGESHYNCKLTKEQILEVKFLLKEGMLSQTEIGILFNICQTQVSKIKLGKVWSYLK